MSTTRNVAQIFTANPISTLGDADLMYVVQGGTTDAAISGANFKLQFPQIQQGVGNPNTLGINAENIGDLFMDTTGTAAVQYFAAINGVGTTLWETPIGLAQGAYGASGALFITMIGTDSPNVGFRNPSNGVLVCAGSAPPLYATTSVVNSFLRWNSATTTPSFSNYGMPASITLNSILFGSATGTVGLVSSVNSAILSTNSSGVPGFSTSLPPFSQALLSVAVNTGMVINNIYKPTVASLVFTLPSTAAVDTTLEIEGNGFVFSIAQLAGQSILAGASTTTVGTGGSLTAANGGCTIKLRCITANTKWQVIYMMSTFTVV